MSEASAPSTPSYGSRSPASSHASGRSLHSDTTPSPSGGNRLSSFSPHKLSSKLALLEASESLAYAAETLSVAAKAMSKAAASLAAASGYQDHEYEYETRESKTRATYASEGFIDSPDWPQPSYTFSPPATTHDEEIYAPDEGYVFGSTPSSEEPAIDPIPTHATPEALPPVDPINIYQDNSGESSTPTQDRGPAPLAGIPPMPVEHKPPTTPVVSITPVASSLPTQPTTEQLNPWAPASSTTDFWESVGAPTPKPVVQTTPTKPAPKQNPLDRWAESSGQQEDPWGIMNPEPPTTPSTSASAPNTSNTHAQPLTRIVLDRGFDALPALCAISTRCAKTICFYPGGDAIQAVGQVLKAHTSQTVIVPGSLKPKRLVAAGRSFTSATSGVLVWPGNVQLSGVKKSGLSDAQIVYLGEPQRAPDVICPKITLILTKSEMTDSKANTPKSIKRKYAIDPLDSSYNNQGAGSPLHPFRVWMRSHLSDMSFARNFYWGWILHYRKQNPKWTAVEVVEATNKYAEEFLLRGDSRNYGEPVGGRVSITRANANEQKLQPAIQAGVLLVC